jgi:hypothetical protein
VTRAIALGWSEPQILVIDEDQGVSANGLFDRAGFAQLTAEVALGRVGIVLGLEVARLARNNADWHRLLDLCGLTDTILADEDGIYDPSVFNDRLLLGLKIPVAYSTPCSTFPVQERLRHNRRSLMPPDAAVVATKAGGSPMRPARAGERGSALVARGEAVDMHASRQMPVTLTAVHTRTVAGFVNRGQVPFLVIGFRLALSVGAPPRQSYRRVPPTDSHVPSMSVLGMTDCAP